MNLINKTLVIMGMAVLLTSTMKATIEQIDVMYEHDDVICITGVNNLSGRQVILTSQCRSVYSDPACTTEITHTPPIVVNLGVNNSDLLSLRHSGVYLREVGHNVPRDSQLYYNVHLTVVGTDINDRPIIFINPDGIRFDNLDGRILVQTMHSYFTDPFHKDGIHLYIVLNGSL